MKAKITRPGGIVVEAEGTPEEIARLLNASLAFPPVSIPTPFFPAGTVFPNPNITITPYTVTSCVHEYPLNLYGTRTCLKCLQSEMSPYTYTFTLSAPATGMLR